MTITAADDIHTTIMRKAGQILMYVKEHEDHPQAESLQAPNRVAIDEGYYASIHVDQNVPVVVIWASDDPKARPRASCSRRSLIINPAPDDSPEQVLTAEDIDFLITKFQTLLNVSFFKG